MRTKIKDIVLQKDHSLVVGKEHVVKGWVKTVRSQKSMTFVEINDGSCFSNIQVLFEPGIKDYEKIIPQLTTRL